MNKILSNEEIEDLQLQMIYKNIAKHIPVENEIGIISGKFYKKEFIVKNNLCFNPELKRAEDQLFLLNAFEKNGKYKYFKDFLYNYRKSNKSTVNKFSYNIGNNFMTTLKELHEFVAKKPEIFMQAYYARVILYISMALENDYFHKKNKENKQEKFLRLKKLIQSDVFHMGMKRVNKKLLIRSFKIIIYLLMYNKYNLLYGFYILRKLKKLKNRKSLYD